MLSTKQLLAYFETGVMTRSELVSALAQREIAPSPSELCDEGLARDVADLRARIAKGDTFIISSHC